MELQHPEMYTSYGKYDLTNVLLGEGANGRVFVCKRK
jgi:hypothetical protein